MFYIQLYDTVLSLSPCSNLNVVPRSDNLVEQTGFVSKSEVLISRITELNVGACHRSHDYCSFKTSQKIAVGYLRLLHGLRLKGYPPG